MSEIKLREPDDDLIPLLRQCSSEELDNLVGYLTKKRMGVSELQHTAAYREWHPDHARYADEIAAEIQKHGGNTVLNLMRGGMGAPYREIVCKVAARLKVDHEADWSVARIEQQILLKVLETSWEKMSEPERTALLTGLATDAGDQGAAGEFPAAMMKAALIAGGAVASYQLALIVAGGVARATLQRGLAFAAGVALSRWAAAFAGAVGLGLAAMWTLFEVLGPAYRVLLPCIIHIAMLRQLHGLKELGVDPESIPAVTFDSSQAIH